MDFQIRLSANKFNCCKALNFSGDEMLSLFKFITLFVTSKEILINNG